MIGAMPAVAVRHERRKVKGKDPGNMILGVGTVNKCGSSGSSSAPGSGSGSSCPAPSGARPSHLLLKPHLKKSDLVCTPLAASTAPSLNASRQASRAGTPTPADPIHTTTHVRYGDECFYGKVSLLHFIIFFLLGGLTLLIVGAVQFKREAGLSNLRYHFLVAGVVLILGGFALLVVKCIWFRRPIHVLRLPTAAGASSPGDDEDEDDDDDGDDKDEDGEKAVINGTTAKKSGGGKASPDKEELPTNGKSWTGTEGATTTTNKSPSLSPSPSPRSQPSPAASASSAKGTTAGQTLTSTSTSRGQQQLHPHPV